MFYNLAAAIAGIGVSDVDKGFPDPGYDGRLADGSIPVVLGRELKRLNLDLEMPF